MIGSWILKWFANTATGQLDDMAGYSGDYWWDYITGSMDGLVIPIIFFLIFTLLCVAVIVIGVRKGIEKLNLLLMPLLIVMIVAVTIYCLVTVDGIVDGLVYYLSPDVSKLTGGTFLGAVSQVFFSMSLSSGTLVAYGSYMKKKDNIEECVREISLIDTGVAIIAGLMIVPAAYAFGYQDSQGMGLIFTAIPHIFAQMQAGGLFASVFYLLVMIAALTSAVSMMEALVAQVIDLKKVKRTLAIVAVVLMIVPVGLLVVLGFGPLMTDLYPFDQGAGILGILDTLANSLVMPLVAILTCIMVGYAIGTKTIIEEVESCGNRLRNQRRYTVMIKYVCPILLTIMMVLGITDMLGIFDLY